MLVGKTDLHQWLWALPSMSINLCELLYHFINLILLFWGEVALLKLKQSIFTWDNFCIKPCNFFLFYCFLCHYFKVNINKFSITTLHSIVTCSSKELFVLNNYGICLFQRIVRKTSVRVVNLLVYESAHFSSSLKFLFICIRASSGVIFFKIINF